MTKHNVNRQKCFSTSYQIKDLAKSSSHHIYKVTLFDIINNEKIERKKKHESSSKRNRTSVPGFKVPCANHYTTEENY